MTLFRKKTQIDVEAYQLTKDLVLDSIINKTPLLGLRMASASYHVERREVHHAKFVCKTVHGQDTFVEIGDWVITEPGGCFYYPCKPEIFEARYEPSPQEEWKS